MTSRNARVHDTPMKPPPDPHTSDRADSSASQPLTTERIVAAAIAIADKEGVEAVVMRRVATELDCATMSLYRHVRTKDELHDLMVDAAIGASPLPAQPSGDWRADLTALAHAHRTTALRHPWLPRLAATRPSIGSHTLAATEFALTALDKLGLPIRTMIRTVSTVLSFTHGFIQTEVEQRRRRRSPNPPNLPLPSAITANLRQLTSSNMYPQITRMLNESTPDPDTEFAWQLDRVLDGLATAFPAAARFTRG